MTTSQIQNEQPKRTIATTVLGGLAWAWGDGNISLSRYVIAKLLHMDVDY